VSAPFIESVVEEAALDRLAGVGWSAKSAPEIAPDMPEASAYRGEVVESRSVRHITIPIAFSARMPRVEARMFGGSGVTVAMSVLPASGPRIATASVRIPRCESEADIRSAFRSCRSRS